MSITKYRTPRRLVPWWWFGPYIVVVVIYLIAVLLLVRHGLDPVTAVGVPAAVSAVAITAVDRLGRLAGFARPAPVAGARRRRA